MKRGRYGTNMVVVFETIPVRIERLQAVLAHLVDAVVLQPGES